MDDYHGTKVPDPYRGFEALDSEQTKQWVDAENNVTRPILEKLPNREWLKQRLTSLWSYERYGVAQKAGSNYFFTRNDGKQNQSVLYVSGSLAAPGKVLFDPNTALERRNDRARRVHAEPEGRRRRVRDLRRRY